MNRISKKELVICNSLSKDPKMKYFLTIKEDYCKDNEIPLLTINYKTKIEDIKNMIFKFIEDNSKIKL
jgi:hypothetical protein